MEKTNESKKIHKLSQERITNQRYSRNYLITRRKHSPTRRDIHLIRNKIIIIMIIKGADY